MKKEQTASGEKRLSIVAALQEIASLLRLNAVDPFRARAYAKAAEAIAQFSGDLEALIDRKELTTIKGIGQSIAGVIEELFLTGRSPLLDKLRAEFPAGAVALSQIPGLTAKRIRTLNSELGITSTSELKEALESGKVRELTGFGAKTESALLEQL